MSAEAEQAAIQAVHDFIETFNAQDHERHAATLNYPHVRLAAGRFTQTDSAEQFAELSRQGEARLAAEGWHHTIVSNLEVVHSGEDKVHLALTNDRCDANGQVYHRFDTLWIATLVDGKWGIQFRSSFLHAK
ncbi:MAG: hypothetical protein KDI36_17410 [Pseudomonadales bacterium]|nr:hypothetical protein [Pseudomonadales bacterium]